MPESFDSATAEEAGDEFSAVTEQAAASVRGLEASANGFARAMTQAFSRAIVDGRRFDDVLKSLALRLSNMAVKAAFKPLEQAFAGGLQNLFGGLFGGDAAGAATGADKGLVAAMSDIRPFASGGVIASPTYFPLGSGTMGLAGEAGPEAILPLARGADGRLGVVAATGRPATHVTVNIATPDAGSFRRSEVYITGQIARAVARGQRGL